MKDLFFFSIFYFSLRLIHQDYVSNFVTFLVNANEKSIHQKCLDFIMIAVYKFLNGLSSQIMNEIFRFRKKYLQSKTYSFT